MSQLSFLKKAMIAAVITTAATAAFAVDVNGRIRGTVTDPAGAVIPNAQVTATNQATGVKFTTTSQGNGGYTFQQLPIGSYTISASAPGFKGFSASGIVLNIDQEYVEPVQLQVGGSSETVEVQADAVQVNTTDMQLNNIVDSHQITELPLIGRGFTGLELILPGVQQSNDRFGSFSVNGSQSQQSSYLINGADSNDLPLNTIGIQPNIDALAQFNLVTGPLNAEYDRSSGAIVSTAIKQGTNHFHGDVFEFYRDTFLNTRNYFQKLSPTPKYHQNIFGGTLGGPILKDKLFFFGAYQGIRQAVPQVGGSVNVFTPAQLSGDYTGTAFSTNVIPATISIPGCVSGVDTFASCFATGKVPVQAFDPVSVNLAKKYIPAPNGAAGANTFSFAPVTGLTQNQYIGRFDVNPTSKDQFYGLGIHQFQKSNDTLPFTGATIPGFGDQSTSSIYQFSAGYTRTITSSAVNDFQLHYTRFNFDLVEPQNIVTPASLGFAITPQNAAAASVPAINIVGAGVGSTNFELGFSTNGPQPRIDQVYQADDNFSKTLGHHNFKIGYDGRRYNVANPFYARNSGSFTFSTSGNNDTSGDAGLDFLLGIPSTYSQGSGGPIKAYAFLNYFYAQDTWKAADSLTISYGLGYQVDTPLHNLQFKGIGVTCYIPGQQSKVFTSAPKGLNYPGDPGCNNASGAKTKYGDFGPRIGFAFTPNLGLLSGGDAKKLAVRAGFGIYYNRTEEETSLQNLQDPPFGLNTQGAPSFGVATNPSFANPFVDLNTGVASPNPFPFVPPAAGSAPDYSAFLPLALSQYAPGFRSPYSENFQLTLEREFPSQIVARASYVGTLGRHNQLLVEGNPITTAGHDACLADAACSGKYRNQQPFNYPTHTQFGYADPKFFGLNDFGSIGLISTEGSSNYNSLQLSVDKGLTHGFQFQASYTLAHALDNGSSFEDAGFGGAGGVNGSARGYNQYVPGASYGNSSYDVRHRFVFAPIYVVPFKTTGSAFSPTNLLLSGWQVSAIATFATGFPFDISYGGFSSSKSLYCAVNTTYYACPDVPNQTGPLVLANQRTHVLSKKGAVLNQTRFFQNQNFAPEALGTFGNISRNKYHGPGTNNTNLILAKNFSLSSDATRYLQLRAESDNVFNHTNFFNPNGNYASGNFGVITSAAPGRQTQLAAKIYF